MGSTKYSTELRERAIAMVAEAVPEHGSEFAAIKHVAGLLGITTPETLRKWIRQHEVDQGTKPGVTTTESDQVKALKREVAELKRANGILKAAASFFAAEIDRPYR